MLAYAHALVELVHLGEASGRFVLFEICSFSQILHRWLKRGHLLFRVVNFCSAKSFFGSSKTPSDSAKKPSDSAKLDFDNPQG